MSRCESWVAESSCYYTLTRTGQPRQGRTNQDRTATSSDGSIWTVVQSRRQRRKNKRRSGNKRSSENTITLSGSAGSNQSPPPKPSAVKDLRTWGLKYSGEEREDAEEFLESLRDCLESSNISELEILRARPCVLSKGAARWYRTIKREVRTWREFERAFHRRFVKQYDRIDLLDDLNKRTKGKDEKITEYVAALKYIVSRFPSRPPSRRELVNTAYRNLLPEYHRTMSERYIGILAELESYGRRWERQKELNDRYTPPPPPEKMHVRGAAYEPASRSKSAATTTDENACAASDERRKWEKNRTRMDRRTGRIFHERANRRQTRTG